MTLGDITTRINFLTGTTVNEYSAAARLVSLNKWYNQVSTWILASLDEWDFDDSNQTDFPVLKADLVDGQADYGGLKTEGMLNMKRVEVSYDGVVYYKARPLDLGEDDNPLDTTNIAADFPQSEPRYRIVGDSIILYPTPNAAVTNGLTMYIDRAVIEFTSADVTTGTAVPGFDINFHDLLALGVSYDYNSAKKSDKSLMQDILLMKADLIGQYADKIEDRKHAVTPNIEDYS